MAEPGKLHVGVLVECKVDRPLDPLRVPYGPFELLPGHGRSGFLVAVAHVEKGHAGFWCDVHSFSFVMVYGLLGKIGPSRPPNFIAWLQR